MRTKRRAGGIFLVALSLGAQSVAAPKTLAAPPSQPSITAHHLLAKTPLGTTGTDLVLGDIVAGSPGEAIVVGIPTVVTLDGIEGAGPLMMPTNRPDATVLGVADIDGDGALDIIGGSVTAGLTLLEGDVSTSLMPLAETPQAIESIDADDDPSDELALLIGGTKVLVIDLDPEDPVITHEIDLVDSAGTLVTGDLIVGGRDELIAVGGGPATTIALLADGNATTAPLDVADGAFAGAIDRVDQDEHPDLVVAAGGGFEVLRGDGQGGLVSDHVEHMNGVLDIDVTDAVEGQCAAIVVTTANEILEFRPLTDGTYPAPLSVNGTTDNVAAELEDMNDDGISDLVVLEDSGAAVTILRTNRAPEIQAHGEVIAVEEATVTIPTTGTDPDGDPITYDVKDAPEGSTVDHATGTFTWTPDTAGVRSIGLVASDWYDEVTDTITITVTEKPHVGQVQMMGWKAPAVTGKVALKATVAPAERVVFEWARSGSDTWHKVGEDTKASDGWAAMWGTGDKNGLFRLRARALSGDESSTDTTSIKVDNRAPRIRMRSAKAFSPNGDGRYDSLAIRARSDELARFKLFVKRDGRVLRRWSWATPRNSMIVRWNGRVDGKKLRDGSYRLVTRARDLVRLGGRDDEGTKIDTKAPSFRWRRVPHGLVTRTGPLGVRYRANDWSGAVRLRLGVVQAGRKVAHKTTKMNRRRGRWSIQPHYGDGSAFVPGSYSIHARVADRVGNVRRVSPKRWEYAPPRSARAYMRLEGTGHQLALTFDDCNFGNAWQSILNTLKAHNVKATFFCNGANVRQNASSAKRTVRDGHDVAAHGYNHLVMPSVSSYTARSQISRDRVAWMDVTGRAGVPFFRPPYGAYNAGTVSIAGSLGFSRVMIWDVDPQDWKTQSAISTSSHVLSRARSGSVVLMHVLPSTAAALPSILRGLKGRGLKPVTLTTLFRSAGHH